MSSIHVRYDLEDWEHVTTMKNLELRSQETHTGRKGFVCLGTTLLIGEEFASRGRVSSFYGQLILTDEYNSILILLILDIDI